MHFRQFVINKDTQSIYFTVTDTKQNKANIESFSSHEGYNKVINRFGLLGISQIFNL